MRDNVVFLVGPTAIGKTAVSLRLAKKINAEIISCDSMQIYRGMDVIASKPPASALKKIAHHLISNKSPAQIYNVSDYRKAALKKIKEITKKGKVPLFVGGTGLYMSVLLDGIFEEDQDQDEVQRFREKLYQQAQNCGKDKLYARLCSVDPSAAAKIHPNDLKRIVRALEVYERTGVPISQLQKKRKGITEDYDVKIFGLNMGRDELYARIDQRVDKMFKLGLLAEVKKLLKLKLSQTASQAIGIKELKGYFSGECSLDEAKRLMKQNTRRYAKRQFTWFRKDKRINWVDISNEDSPSIIADRLTALL